MPRHPDPRALERRAQALGLLRQGLSRRDVAAALGVWGTGERDPGTGARSCPGFHLPLSNDPVFAAAVHKAEAAVVQADIDRGAALLRSGMRFVEINAELGRPDGWAQRVVPRDLDIGPLEGQVMRAFEAGADTCGQVADATGIPVRRVRHRVTALLRRGLLVDTGRTVLVRGHAARVIRPA